MKNIIFILAVLVAVCGYAASAAAFLSPHPIELYDRGEALITNYMGNGEVLIAAQDIFLQVIEKYPYSPFGYLGMSRLYRIDAHLGDENYDLTLIRERALPFALKALQLGPSIRAVHENYAFFERFFSDEK